MELQISNLIRSTWLWLIGNVRTLALVSLIPAILLVLMAVLQSQMQMSNFQDLLTGSETSTPQLPGTGQIFKNMIMALLVFLISVWLSVKVTRLRLLGVGAVGPASPDEITCTYRSLFYQIALIGLFVSTYLIGLLLILAISYIFGSISPAVLFALGVLAILGVAYALVRFSAALPAIAVGLKPKILRDMWPFAREYTWSLMGWVLLMAVLVTLVFLLLSYLLMSGSFDAMQQSPAAYLEYMKANRFKVIMANVIFSLLNIPVYWFFMLFFAEAFEKIAAQKGIWRADHT